MINNVCTSDKRLRDISSESEKKTGAYAERVMLCYVSFIHPQNAVFNPLSAIRIVFSVHNPRRSHLHKSLKDTEGGGNLAAPLGPDFQHNAYIYHCMERNNFDGYPLPAYKSTSERTNASA